MKRVRLLVSVSLWVSAVLSIFFAPFTPAAASPPTSGIRISPHSAGWPISIAATGDSITRAFNTGSVPFTDAPANSWSTGTNSSVNPHYTRILAVNPGISGHSFNDAVTGAKMVDLNGQIATVNSQHVDYLTILLGANDACRPTEDQMTP